MVKIGVDIIEINRIKQTYGRFKTRFLNRIFTKSEVDYAFKFRDPFPHLAVRFAAKEALFKATGELIPYSKIEILGWPPVVKIDGELMRSISVSISHGQSQAVAMVLWENSGS